MNAIVSWCSFTEGDGVPGSLLVDPVTGLINVYYDGLFLVGGFYRLVGMQYF